MPMIDVYATSGTFPDKHQLAVDLAHTVMTVEQVPDIPLFRKNTAAFIHDLAEDSLANVDGDHNHVRVQVLTNRGALDRDKQLTVVRQLTDVVAQAAGDPTLTERTWVLLTEAPEGGWGINGHANTNTEIVQLARDQLAEINAASSS
jgi:phenylpyruvate tautomerase PptA (4-oxalocrotonate tautomerase family)